MSAISASRLGVSDRSTFLSFVRNLGALCWLSPVSGVASAASSKDCDNLDFDRYFLCRLGVPSTPLLDRTRLESASSARSAASNNIGFSAGRFFVLTGLFK
jgi:hypothetical protein